MTELIEGVAMYNQLRIFKVQPPSFPGLPSFPLLAVQAGWGLGGTRLVCKPRDTDIDFSTSESVLQQITLVWCEYCIKHIQWCIVTQFRTRLGTTSRMASVGTWYDSG